MPFACGVTLPPNPGPNRLPRSLGAIAGLVYRSEILGRPASPPVIIILSSAHPCN